MNGKSILILTILIAMTAVTVGFFWFLQKNNQGCIAVVMSMRNLESGECRVFPSPCAVPQSGWMEDDNCLKVAKIDDLAWKTYKNEAYGFALNYPADFSVSETDLKSFSAKNDGKESSFFLSVRVRENHQFEGDMIFQGKSAKKYFYREGAGYSGVFLTQLEAGVLEISYDMIGGKDQETFVESNFDKIIASIKFQ